MSKLQNRDIFWSLFSQGLPALVALASIPILVRSYGMERFGLLTFFWMVLNYLSFLDLGITRSLIKTISSTSSTLHSSAVMKSGFLFLLFMGILGTISMLIASGFIVDDYLNLSSALEKEARVSLYAAAATLPALLIFSFFKSTLEGNKNFSQANFLNLATGLITYIVPILCLLASKRLDVALVSMAIIRWLLAVCAFFLSTDTLGKNWFQTDINRGHFKILFREGFWFSLLAIINPLLIYLDRFLVTSFLPMNELAKYTAPFEIVTRFWLVPMAVTRVIFPFFSTHEGRWDKETSKAFNQGLLWIALLLIPPCAIIFVWGHELLGLWLGNDFKTESATILKILTVGVFFNSLNWIPFTLLQASKHIRWTVYIPILEILVFVALFEPLVSHFGVTGAAIAWSGRLILDSILWFSFVAIQNRAQRSQFG